MIRRTPHFLGTLNTLVDASSRNSSPRVVLGNYADGKYAQLRYYSNLRAIRAFAVVRRTERRRIVTIRRSFIKYSHLRDRLQRNDYFRGFEMVVSRVVHGRHCPTHDRFVMSVEQYAQVGVLFQRVTIQRTYNVVGFVVVCTPLVRLDLRRVGRLHFQADRDFHWDSHQSIYKVSWYKLVGFFRKVHSILARERVKGIMILTSFVSMVTSNSLLIPDRFTFFSNFRCRMSARRFYR